MDIWHAFQEKFDFDDTVTLLKQNGIEANRWGDAYFWCRETISMPKPLAFVFSMYDGDTDLLDIRLNG